MSWFENIPSVFENQGGVSTAEGFGSPAGTGGPAAPGGGLSSLFSTGSNTSTATGMPASSGSGSKSGFDPTSMFGALAAGGALAYNLSKGDKPPEGVANLGTLANQFAGQAGALNTEGLKYMSYLESGTLPTGLEQQVDQWTQGAKARYLQAAAKSGMNADPAQNSALAQDLNSVASQAAAMRSDFATKLLQAGNTMVSQGIQYSQMQSQLFTQLANYSIQQSKETGSAITNFASALGSFASKALPAILAL